MADEIERKFVLPAVPRERLTGEGRRIDQGYVALDEGAEVRIRRRGEEHTLTIKSSPARTRVEVEMAIDAERFEALWALTAGRRVVKTRHLIEHGGLTVELDEYHDALAGLVTAEVEFASEADADAFEAPEWLGTEVTGDARYANQALAVGGRPPGRT
jgi:adenylate cyclase